MLNKYLILLFSLIITACGESSTGFTSNSDSSTTEESSESSESSSFFSSTSDECNDFLPAPPHSFPDTINDPLYSEQWHINSGYTRTVIDSEAHIHTATTTVNYLSLYTGQNIKIAVIDDGLDVTHEDLQSAVTHTFDIATNCNDVSHNRNEYHGTAVTGILGARSNSLGIKGIASNSEILFLKFKDSMSDSEFITLFNKADEWGADIINNSWGTGNVSQSVKDTIVNLSKNGRNGKGINIVFATGNENKEIGDIDSLGNDESAIPEVISVGASSENNDRALYSQWGSQLDILAPAGENLGIQSLDPMAALGFSPTANYLSISGTSSAAPIVSGVIALLLEKNPDLSSSEISVLLHDNAEKIGTEPYIDGRNDKYGYGKVHLSNVIQAIP